MLHMGGSFSPKGSVHDDYKALLQENHDSRFTGKYNSLEELVAIMSQFIWSEKAYRAQVEEFWEEIHPSIDATQ